MRRCIRGIEASAYERMVSDKQAGGCVGVGEKKRRSLSNRLCMFGIVGLL